MQQRVVFCFTFVKFMCCHFVLGSYHNFLHRHKPKTAGKGMAQGGGEEMNVPVEVGGDMPISQSAYFCGLQKTTCI